MSFQKTLLLWLFTCSLVGTSLLAQPPIEYSYYSNQYQNLTNLWFISDEYKLGFYQDQGYEGYQLVLINNENLVVDTLSRFIPWHMVYPMGNNEFVIQGRINYTRVSCADGAFNILENYSIQDASNQYKFPLLEERQVFLFQNAKGRQPARMVAMENQELGDSNSITQVSAVVEIRGQRKFRKAPNFRLKQTFSRDDQNYYFFDDPSQTLYIIGLKGQESKVLPLPLDKKDIRSWAYYHDVFTHRHYALRYSQGGIFELFRVNLEEKSIYLISEVNHIPTAIVGDKMHVVYQNPQGISEHYMVPIYESIEPKPILLDDQE